MQKAQIFQNLEKPHNAKSYDKHQTITLQVHSSPMGTKWYQKNQPNNRKQN